MNEIEAISMPVIKKNIEPPKISKNNLPDITTEVLRKKKITTEKKHCPLCKAKDYLLNVELLATRNVGVYNCKYCAITIQL